MRFNAGRSRIDGVPAIAIDPKGDLGNLLLSFPELRATDFRPWVDEGEAQREGKNVDDYAKQVAQRWRKGLAEWDQDGERIRRLQQKVELALYTPGSTAGRPLRLLQSFAPGQDEDTEVRSDRIEAFVASLLALLGMDADPLRSREFIFLAQILDHAWQRGRLSTWPRW